jgi:hypothetical protein
MRSSVRSGEFGAVHPYLSAERQRRAAMLSGDTGPFSLLEEVVAGAPPTSPI